MIDVSHLQDLAWDTLLVVQNTVFAAPSCMLCRSSVLRPIFGMCKNGPAPFKWSFPLLDAWPEIVQVVIALVAASASSGCMLAGITTSGMDELFVMLDRYATCAVYVQPNAAAGGTGPLVINVSHVQALKCHPNVTVTSLMY